MDDRIRELVQALLDDKRDSYPSLVGALKSGPGKAVVELLAHDAPSVRCAAVDAAAEHGGEVLEAALRLLDDPSPWVRRRIAPLLPDDAAAALARLLDDEDYEVRRAAAKAAPARHEERLFEMLFDDPSWEVREACATSLGGFRNARAAPPLVRILGQDDDVDVRRACAAAAEKILGGHAGWPAEVAPPKAPALQRALDALEQLQVRRYRVLHKWLGSQLANEPDLATLREIGTDLTAAAQAGELPRAYGTGAITSAVRGVLESPGTRAVVLLGPSGVGKTAAIHELVHELEDWRVIRVVPSEILTGTLYLGEWETKVGKLIAAASAPKKVLLYVPNLEELSAVGRTSKSDTNAATMLAPHIESGRLAIIGETTPETFRSGLGRQASLRRLFTAVEVAPAADRDARDLIELVAAEAGVEVDEAFCDRLMELGGFYLQGTAQPGRTLGLLRRVIDACREQTAPLTPRDILTTLHEFTGVPTGILDDAVPLDVDATRAFFEARVMGQTEALDAVVDLVTLVKAGLHDPGKPYGVLFFVGPTGVGKTELARALAEFLFGDANRLCRYDMSEYANYAAFERLGGLLAQAVGDQPFSVFLLDEIEKAHSNVFDLCLQLFDAGRITDAQGRTADFRNTIVILTSNVGSRIRTEAGVGFGGDAPPPPDRATIDRELRRFFRPEFLNRLDRVVHFQPLAAETAEQIARRELAGVVERSGIARRQLAVDVDPSIVALLLKHGYSPAFGARPLKRTVERMVLLPVARAIAAGTAKPGSILRLSAAHDEVRVAIVPPDGPDDAAAEEEVPALADVRRQIEALRPDADALRARKAELLESANAPGFWDDRAGALGILDRVHRLEKVLDDLARLERNVETTARNRDPAKATRYAAKHAREARRLAELLADGDLADALVTLTLLKRRGKELDGVEVLAKMYLGFARQRGLEGTVIDDRRGGEPAEDTISLFVAGAGAYAFLRREAGIHTLTRPATGGKPELKSLVRVDVLRAPIDLVPYDGDVVRVEEKPLPRAPTRLMSRPNREVRMLHVPSMTSLRAWANDDTRDALHALLRARVENGAAESSTTVRRYRLGTAPLVSDSRTGKTTGKLDRVLAGELDLLGAP